MTQEVDFSSKTDRLPPQSIEAESAILGGIMLDPEAISRVSEILIAEAFYLSAHSCIYQAAQRLYTQGKPTDLLSVTNWLSDNGLLFRIGGRNKLATLVDRTVSAVNIDALTDLVMEKYQRRQLIKAGNEIVKLGYQTETELPIVLDLAEQKVFNITSSRSSTDLVHISDSLADTFTEIEARHAGTASPALSTGFYDLDSLLGGGFRRKRLYVLAARPSVGKSALAGNIALNVAQLNQVPVSIFSLEMSLDEYVHVKVTKQLRGRVLTTEEIAQLMQTCFDDPTPTGYRDAALFTILRGAGVRRSEVVNLDLRDIDLNTGAIQVRAGKGGKDRTVYLPESGLTVVSDWLSLRGYLAGPLLCHVNRGSRIVRRRLTSQAVLFILQKRGAQAFVANFSAHDFRRTFISELLDAGEDISTVQRLAGHANSDQTARYDRRGEQTKRRAVQKLTIPGQRKKSPLLM